jgi:hypothetical protein
MRRLLVAFIVPLALALPARALAQTTRVEAYLPADHWSRDALRRLAGAGLLRPADVLGAWPLPRDLARLAFDSAAARATGSFAAHARAYAVRLSDDFAPSTARFVLRGHAGIGWTGREDVLIGGRSVPSVGGFDYTGPVPQPDFSRALYSAALDGAIGQRFAFALAVRDSIGDPQLSSAYGAFHIGLFRLWAGRRAFDAGVAHNGSFVLTEGHAFDGAGFDTDPFHIRGPLRILGPVRLSMLLSRFERSGDVRHPWFAAMRITTAPHPTLAIGIQRAALFGGEGNESVDPWRVILLAAGLPDVPGKDSDFENQVLSFDAYWQPAGAPISFHAEWGTDDTGGALIVVPGFRIGAELHGIAPPGLSLGVEHTFMAPRFRPFSEWYLHGALAEGWTDRGRLLGHPLGGHGWENALLFDFATSTAGFLAAGRVFHRHRGHDNLFAPDWHGHAVGGAVRFDWRFAGSLRLRGHGSAEKGRDWRGGAEVGVLVVW